MLGLDYYQRAFVLLHKDLEESGYDHTIPHPKRAAFWSLVPYGHHGSTEARALLLQYARTVEERIKEIVEGASLAYWLHLYRRIAPGPTVQRDSSVTVGITRAALEAAFQKYARLDPCHRVGLSTSVPVGKVLGGILQGPEFELECKHISEKPQLVMMDFSTNNLRELYDLEKLAFEIWRTGAHLRCVGKGSGIRVTNDLERIADDRSDELDTLVRSFDARNNAVYGLPHTMTGTVLDESRSEVNGLIMIPGYNLDLAKIQPHHRRYFEKVFHINVTKSWRPNFFWSVFDLRGYYRTHQPLATGFEQSHGVSYHSVFAVLAALSFRTLFRSVASAGGTLFQSWQRAYEGPYLRSYVVEELNDHAPAAKRLLGMTDQEWQEVDLDHGMEFWSLRDQKRSMMDLMYPGPHSVFLPYGNDRVFIDYTWIGRRLYDLFVGVSIPDQNFKGIALEELVRAGTSELPVGPCINNEGEHKQIDAAFRVGNRLVIAECRAKARSIAFDRGDPKAIHYRQEFVDRILMDVDEKARWLGRSPKGRNYDIRWAQAIVPIGVTPFVEFMPSLATNYWLAQTMPRVLTPQELRAALNNAAIGKARQNLVQVSS